MGDFPSSLVFSFFISNMSAANINNISALTFLNNHKAVTSYEQDFYDFCESKIKQTRKNLLKSIQNVITKKEEVKQLRITKRKQDRFFSLVLERLPFLYFDSVEVENYHWSKLAFDLYQEDNIIPEIVRYKIGSSFFISFGSIANQIKREFLLMFAKNYDLLSLNHGLGYYSIYNDVIGNLTKTYRDKSIDIKFHSFSADKIKFMTLTEPRPSSDFKSSLIPSDESQTDWYHKWGFLYQCNEDSLRVIEMKIVNYQMEIVFLNALLNIYVQSGINEPHEKSVAYLMVQKKRNIQETFLPELEKLQQKRLNDLKKVKKGSQAYYDILHY